MVKRAFVIFLILIALVGCGGGSGSGSSGLKELPLNTGSDPVISSKSYKPSNKLTLDEDKLLENLKKQHYQTEVALVNLPSDSEFSNITDLVGGSNSVDSPVTSTTVQGSNGGGVDSSTGIAIKKSKVKLKSEVSELMSSVQVSGSLQNFSISSIDGNQISFSQYYIYYFMRPSSVSEYAAMFVRINAEGKEIVKVLSDDTKLIFHVYGDGKTIGFTTPGGKNIQIVVKDTATGNTENLDLVFEDVFSDTGIKGEVTLDGSGSSDEQTLTSNSLEQGSAPASDSASDTTKGANFTDTNNQVEGISEADHVKTDGSYIYTIVYNTLKIFDISKGEFAATLDINFDNLGFEEQLILEKKSKGIATDEAISVAQYVYSEINLVDGNIVLFSQYNGKTIVTFVSLADKTAPSVTKQLSFNESLVSSRIVSDQVILVLNDYLYASTSIEIPYHYAFTEEQKTQFTAANEELVKNLTLADFGMDVSFEKTVGNTTETVNYLDTSKVYLDENSGGYSLSKVLVIDTSANVVSATGVLTDYTQNIYVTADSVVLYNTTWESRIEWWNFDWAGSEKTMIYYFDLNNSALEFVDGVEVTGRPQGVFSFHKSGSNLFMAYHDDTTGDNGIHTVAIGEELSTTNTLSGIATGESLQSVRFIDSKAYLVTYKYVDPFYIVDLTDPNSPSVLGELKTTGFSSYLHLVLEDVILGVGTDSTEEGVFTGAKISTFDVSSETPSEIDKATISGGYPYFNASYDHHAFTWYKSKNLLALPYSGSSSGAIVYRLDDAGNIVEAATIESPNTSNEFYYYSSFNSRIIFVDETLYYVDGGEIKAYPIADLKFSADNKSLVLEETSGDLVTIFTTDTAAVE